MTATRWWKYLQGLMGDQSQLEAANHIGISKSNITRWKNGAPAAPEFVVKVARAYGANVLHALVEAEFITREEADLHEVPVGGVPLHAATDEQLATELLKRLRLIADTEPAPKPTKLRAVRADRDLEEVLGDMDRAAAQELTDPLEEEHP